MSNNKKDNQSIPDVQWYEHFSVSNNVNDNVTNNTDQINVINSLKEQVLQLKNKLETDNINNKNDIILLRHEILNLKETIIQLKDDLQKYKIKNLDERDRNRLIRTNIPFSFFPINSSNSNLNNNTNTPK